MQKNRGIKRILKACLYSYKGLRYAFYHEAAFRQETVAALVLIPLALIWPNPPLEKVLLIIPVFIVLIVELLNTAVEAAVDRIGPEHHKLAGVAKDAASAAVLLSLILLVAVWSVVFLS